MYLPNKKMNKNRRVSRIPRNNLTGLQTIRPNGAIRRKMFYVNLAGSSGIVTSQDLLLSFGGVCTIFNSTLQGFYSALKVLRVRIRASCVNQSISELQLQWLSDSSFFRPGYTTIAVSQSSAQPAAIDQAPPPGSMARQWCQENTGNLFYVSGTGATTGGSFAGPLVMEVEALLVPGIVPSGPPLPVKSITSGILGSVYCLGLTADAWIPQGVNYTT